MDRLFLTSRVLYNETDTCIVWLDFIRVALTETESLRPLESVVDPSEFDAFAGRKYSPSAKELAMIMPIIMPETILRDRIGIGMLIGLAGGI
jgi:hypothetical protein